jgi:hypothetical protein
MNIEMEYNLTSHRLAMLVDSDPFGVGVTSMLLTLGEAGEEQCRRVARCGGTGSASSKMRQ